MARGSAGWVIGLIWLVGLPLVLASGRGLVGLVCLIGLASIAQGILSGGLLRAAQIACWSFGFASFVTLPESPIPLALFAAGTVLMVVAVVRSLVIRPPAGAKKPVDTLLE